MQQANSLAAHDEQTPNVTATSPGGRASRSTVTNTLTQYTATSDDVNSDILASQSLSSKGTQQLSNSLTTSNQDALSTGLHSSRLRETF